MVRTLFFGLVYLCCWVILRFLDSGRVAEERERSSGVYFPVFAEYFEHLTSRSSVGKLVQNSWSMVCHTNTIGRSHPTHYFVRVLSSSAWCPIAESLTNPGCKETGQNPESRHYLVGSGCLFAFHLQIHRRLKSLAMPLQNVSLETQSFGKPSGV